MHQEVEDGLLRALGHDADDPFGAGGADEHAAFLAEARLGAADRFPEVGLGAPAAPPPDRHVDELLRELLDLVRQFGERPAGSLHHPGDLEGGEDTVLAVSARPYVGPGERKPRPQQRVLRAAQHPQSGLAAREGEAAPAVRRLDWLIGQEESVCGDVQN